jgi:rhamnulokinase
VARKVCAGLAEASAAGSILIQAKTLGYVKSTEEIRDIVRHSFELRTFHPSGNLITDSARDRFGAIAELKR